MTLNFIKKLNDIDKKAKKNAKISQSLKNYHTKHPNKRRIPVYEAGVLVGYCYADKKTNFTPSVSVNNYQGGNK